MSQQLNPARVTYHLNQIPARYKQAAKGGPGRAPTQFYCAPELKAKIHALAEVATDGDATALILRALVYYAEACHGIDLKGG